MGSLVLGLAELLETAAATLRAAPDTSPATARAVLAEALNAWYCTTGDATEPDAEQVRAFAAALAARRSGQGAPVSRAWPKSSAS